MLTHKDSKLDYLQSLKKPYHAAIRSAKTDLLTIAVELTGYHRKYVTGLLKSPYNLSKPKTTQPRRRERIYGPDVVFAVLTIAHALAGACGELVHPALLEMAVKLESRDRLNLVLAVHLHA